MHSLPADLLDADAARQLPGLLLRATQTGRTLPDFLAFCQDAVLPFFAAQRMVAAIGSVQSGSFVIENFFPVGYPADYVRGLERVIDFVQRPLISCWLAATEPVLITSSTDPRLSALERQECEQLQLLPMVLYGLVDFSGINASYFSIAGIGGDSSAANLTCKAKLLVPQLHRLLAELSEIGEVATPAASAGAALTPAEQQVLRFLLQGLSNKDIGLLLQRSPYTIKNQVQSILAKLGQPTRQALIQAAAHRNLRNKHR